MSVGLLASLVRVLGLVACLLALLAAPLAVCAGLVRPHLAALVGSLVAAASCVAFTLAAAQSGGTLVDVAWLPAPISSRLVLTLDGLSGLYTVLVTGLGAVVTVYSRGYLPRHLNEHERPASEEVRFVGLLLAFMASMVALVLAGDLLAMFVALDLTAVLSFLLIRFDFNEREARQASLTALFVTAGSSPLFLIGALLLWREHGTTSLDELFAARATAPVWAGGLIVAGVLAKSAQVPLQFWLGRAMVAPTPVSAFLHSAAMVAGGVIVLQRVRPLLEGAPAVLSAVMWIGLASIVVGSLGALVRDELKAVLASSTIAHYGHVMVLIGVGGDDGAAGAPLYVAIHGLAKASLFMTAGVVTTVSGRSCLSELGGLWQSQRALALSSLVAVLALAGAPLTSGYFKDELFFAAAWHHAPVLGGVTTVVVALTVAYALRFWTRIFLGRRPQELSVGHGSPWLTAPIVLLATLLVASGLMPQAASELAEAAGHVVAGSSVQAHLSYGLSGAPTASALAAWLLGLFLFALQRRAEDGGSLGERGLWARSFPIVRRLTQILRALSDLGHRIESRDMRDRVGFVLLPSAGLIALAALYTSQRLRVRFGTIALEEVPTALALVVVAGAAIAAASMRRHIAVVLMLSFAGFSLAFVFSATGAPDVALVAVLIETTLTLLFLTVLSRVPDGELKGATESARTSSRRHIGISFLAGGSALFLTWNVMSYPRPVLPTSEYLRLAEHAHAKDVVTAILADFRGLDTMGEMSVLAIAAIGVLALAWRRPL